MRRILNYMVLRHWSRSGIISKAAFHSSPHINQTLPEITHILHFSLVDSLLNYAPDIVSWTAWTGRGCSATTNLA